MFLLAVVVIPFGNVIYTTLNTANDNGNRQDASALASSVLSRLESIPYSQVGFTGGSSGTLATTIAAHPKYAAAVGALPTFYWDADGDGSDGSFTSNVDGDIADETLVTTPSSPPATLKFGTNRVPFAPVMSGVHAGGVSYTVTTHIVEASTSVSACPQHGVPATTSLVDAYKHVFVTITWFNGRFHPAPLNADTIVYPGSLAAYSGPSSNSPPPSAPTNVVPVAAAVTGAVSVSWTVPPGGTVPGCYDVGWSGGNPTINAQQQASSGLVEPSGGSLNADGSTTYTYTTPSSLLQGQEYVFYVTSYSEDGAEFSQSATSDAAQAPTGPLVNLLSPTQGLPGGRTLVTIAGSGLSSLKGPTLAYFGSTAATGVTCSSSTSCTAVDPSTSTASGSVFVTIETPTGPGNAEVSSPQLIPDQFSYAPSITGASYSGSTLSINIANIGSTPPTVTLLPSAAQSGVTCPAPTSGTTTCTLTTSLPAPVAPATTAEVQISVSSAGGSSAYYTLSYS
ncbi:MAG: hypothetical protein JWO62_837 [Acidimicrobiaceae bacterium]|nr:hypothetical protein [Acidimicrobiaceae bacterium]